MTTITYTATSLEDIAKEFEKNANHCRSRAERRGLKRDQWEDYGRADAWEHAASILRRTTLTNEPKVEVVT